MKNMYIIELFFKIKNDLKKKKFKKQAVNGLEIEKCDHLFIPIDSTKKILACSKCGAIHKVEEDSNPFQK
ncbi:MAG: hypothetical protein IJW73_03750 [Candidatus Gastranaerophilales bacterium]|nr:hypothetical protein [Candidatus Gastranaerophilales bacterium]